MDIRNITEGLPDYVPGEELQEMYKYGIEQFIKYQGIELLPDYPLDVNSPKSQIILKDFIGRVIEELTEGYESCSNVNNIMNEHGFNLSVLKEFHMRDIKNHLQNANEEQADAIGFFISLLLFSNILPEDIYSWGFSKEKEVNSLKDVMVLGVRDLFNNSKLELGDMMNTIPHRFPIIGVSDFDSKEEWEIFQSYAPGFLHSSSYIHEVYNKIGLFDVIYELNIARNLLKSRSWKQTQVMTKEIDYQSTLVKAFYLYMGYLTFNGFTPENLLELFFKKQRLNLWRISTNY